ncbi:unnamed protein product (macronuclear) [Paramecium tetraurelia]|uniref:Uncharacterized protein n=1 Tax=Paramecium tetraurelia TaxID=5888 RepID=A0CKS5_PARTE|nr:uncharacterized protein GSPATT00007938001 [Paramecium tetraurelia]CAK71392.1 unnamed protein product [Paramecium tetraurelia]|eukprot:XP_001438789.1 hypothetical protein (macronuclear) [Paramecium tetraurelia strain d4-2]
MDIYVPPLKILQPFNWIQKQITIIYDLQSTEVLLEQLQEQTRSSKNDNKQPERKTRARIQRQ